MWRFISVTVATSTGLRDDNSAASELRCSALIPGSTVRRHISDTMAAKAVP